MKWLIIERMTGGGGAQKQWEKNHWAPHLSLESKWLQTSFAWKLELVESELNFKTTKFFCQHRFFTPLRIVAVFVDVFSSLVSYLVLFRFHFYLLNSFARIDQRSQPSFCFPIHSSTCRFFLAELFSKLCSTHSSSFKQNGWFVSLLFALKISKSK